MTPAWFTDTLTPDLDRALHYTLQWGLEGVALRTVGRGRVPDVNEEKVRRRMEDAELPVVAVDPGLFEGAPSERAAWLNDLARLGEVAAFCRRIGCPRIVVGALGGGGADEAAEPLRRAAEVAARQGVALAVRNEGEGRERGGDLAALLEATGAPGLQACWDPAASVQAGESAAGGLEALAGRLGVVVVRDGEGGGGLWERRTVGEGGVGWRDLLGRLHRAGYDGPLCLDVTGLDAKGGLREATALLYLVRDARRG